MSLPARPLWCLMVSLSLLAVAPESAPAQQGNQQARQPDVAQLWADFNHYVLIARPELAAAAAQALVDQAELSALLEAVESGRHRNWPSILERAQRVEGLADVAGQLEQKIQQARVAVARDPERIAADIQQLPETGRPYRNAVARLRAAGQYAVPQMLDVLRGGGNPRLQPYVMSALVEIGQPVVAPLSRALPDLQPVPQGQVAQVLAEIGYPFPALPYLKQVLENEQTDPTARQTLQTAYDILLSRSDVPTGLSAAELFLILGEMRYDQATRGEQIQGYDTSENVGVVWEFSQRAGLVPVTVPGPIYGDVLAMKASRNALQLNPSLDQALSLHLMANLRRENRLPEGAQDPSYPEQMRPASFYAMLAGPQRLHDVLTRALRDQDAALALDAIEALATTAGTDALINRGAAQQPLLRALSFPDRLVRFRAAEALANARPQESFPGSDRVVPVVTEAIRPGGVRYALVLASDRDRLNELLANVGDQGFEAFGGLSLQDAGPETQQRPAVDLIVTDLDAERLGALLQATAGDYKLGTVPIVSVTNRDRQITIQELFGDERRLTAVAETGDLQTLGSAIEQSMATGPAMDEAMSDELALTALDILRDIGIGGTQVYRIAAAEAALIAALQDSRDEIVVGAADVLALIDSAEAQEAIARNALELGGDLQIALLNSLAQSATHHGNQIPDNLTNRLLQLVEQSEGETALAAARAHGALTLPTQNAVQLIVQ